MSVLDNTYNFKVALKVHQQEGNLVYEYNPFYNYRLNQTMIYYKNRLMTLEEFKKEIGNEDFNGQGNWSQFIPKSETPPVVYQKGELVDFETDELQFSLNHPVNITPQWSYDNSVNLILNDGLNPPRLINSRFSATEKNKYQVCNRKGTNDTNIYDQGEQFDIDTSLYRKTTTIPRLQFSGVSYGGNLSIGNYFFYFRYVDEDGNESDFFAESGLVSIFIGNTADSIRSGFRNENSHKQVKFILSNTDASYAKVRIYYTKATSDIDQNATTEAFRIDKDYKINDSGNTLITISGFEDTNKVTLEEINVHYQVYGSVETQDTAQNMLFLANVDKPKIPYEDLADCALRFYPCLKTEKINTLAYDYSGSITNTYYDASFIYNKVGYWDDEIYRFGIVFILQDNTLSDVYNVLGVKKLSGDTTINLGDFIDKGKRKYLQYDDNYSVQLSEGKEICNAKGVVRISYKPDKTDEQVQVLGINFKVNPEVLKYLYSTLKVKGFFFVRQKRIPTTICQAYTIGIDTESHTPVLPIKDNKFLAESFLSQSKNEEDQRKLTHEFEQHKYNLDPYQVTATAAICPDYDVNRAYLNTLFSASELVCRDSGTQNLLVSDGRHFYPDNFSNDFQKGGNYTNIKVLGIEDNTKLGAINNRMFSARAGEAEEAFRYEYIGRENKDTECSNLLRGSFGPFLGITGYEYYGHLIDIKIPDYSEGKMDDYFKIRYSDKAPFYAISDRFDLDNRIWWISNNLVDFETARNETGEELLLNPLYRGDCYVCQFTHRLNRNFSDPSAPTNDKIVDENCWKENYEVADGVVKKENFDKINLGDVNAVQLGMFVTLRVRSNINLNIRATDRSIVDEVSLYGHERGFYPYHPMSVAGSYKIPEALCYNKGFERSVSERYNFEHPDVPWIKNEFSNRIAYSNIQVQDAFQNGWRTYLGTHYRDYPKTYGSIIRIIEFRGNLVCVFEHGVALIPVNERAVAAEGQGGLAYINTSNVLPENPRIISDIYGSQWRESIIKTPYGIYGVDTIAKKIWRTNGQEFECISDFRVQKFLNSNISLTERELDPIIGIRNVKTHYNKYKQDIMFTFYDNLHGFEEKVWNLCYNELQQQWITFYSWVPSYSENINNSFFSFDRNTSKWIAKLGVSHTGNAFSDGVTLANNIISGNGFSTELSLSNRTLPSGNGVTVNTSYSLERDNYGNYKMFSINGTTLTFTGNYSDIKSEFYKRDENGKVVTVDGKPQYLAKPINANKIVILLNIRCNIQVVYTESNQSLQDAYSGFVNGTKVDAGYYQSVVALIADYNQQFLTTDFWKHGQAGIIDISDTIYPTYWYGKQHPFELEFVVASDPASHKIFDNLQIISNNAEPESFHYEIVGDAYSFAKDKKNMYIRQEATKELYQYNGCDITFDKGYKELREYQRPIKGTGYYDRSTLLPLYYSRQDTINDVEDYYHLKDDVSTKDFSALAGGEIVKYDDEYRIWNHAKAVDIKENGRMRGNMQYKEDRWDIQINPLNIVQKNEDRWQGDKVPVELGQYPIPNEVLTSNIEVPEGFNRGYTQWNWQDSEMKEAKLKDKWIKIRIRYSGTKLAVISAIKTLYSISYS